MKDRITIFPDQLREPLHSHLARVKQLHQGDLEKGCGAVYLPFALARKYPNADKEWGWQYVFPSDRLSADPRSPGVIRRHHVDESNLQKAVKEAVRAAKYPVEMPFAPASPAGAIGLIPDTLNIPGTYELAIGCQFGGVLREGAIGWQKIEDRACCHLECSFSRAPSRAGLPSLSASPAGRASVRFPQLGGSAPPSC